MACCGGRKRSRMSRFEKILKPEPIKVDQVKSQRVKKSVVVKKSLKILLTRPQFYDINYSINPWMKPDSIDKHKALHQWNQLDGTLRRLKAKVIYAKPKSGLPDMVFTANAGFFIKDSEIIVLSNFKYNERKGEEFWFEKFFNNEGYYVRHVDHHFEGSGDCLYLNSVPVGGYGYRTDPTVYDTLVPGVVACELVDPRFYHLDTCFCPLSDNDYLIWPGAFSSEALQKIRSISQKEFSVPEEEAMNFACNAVVIEKNVVLPEGCPKTENILKENGYTTFALPMSEYIKSGGACKCLTLKLP